MKQENENQVEVLTKEGELESLPDILKKAGYDKTEAWLPPRGVQRRRSQSPSAKRQAKKRARDAQKGVITHTIRIPAADKQRFDKLAKHRLDGGSWPGERDCPQEGQREPFKHSSASSGIALGFVLGLLSGVLVSLAAIAS